MAVNRLELCCVHGENGRDSVRPSQLENGCVCVCVCVCVFAVLKMPLKILKMDCQVGNFCGDLAVLFLD